MEESRWFIVPRGRKRNENGKTQKYAMFQEFLGSSEIKLSKQIEDSEDCEMMFIK